MVPIKNDLPFRNRELFLQLLFQVHFIIWHYWCFEHLPTLLKWKWHENKDRLYKNLYYKFAVRIENSSREFVRVYNFLWQPFIYFLSFLHSPHIGGLTVQKLHLRLNKHRNNINKTIMLQSVPRHISTAHPDIKNPYKITPIDHVPSTVANRFETLKRRESCLLPRYQKLKSGPSHSTILITTYCYPIATATHYIRYYIHSLYIHSQY